LTVYNTASTGDKMVAYIENSINQ